MVSLHFEFSTAGRILFGPDSLNEISSLSQWGKHALLVVGHNPERASCALQLLHKSGIATSIFSVHGEPTVDTVNQATTVALSSSCDLVIGMGGGSVIDTAKAVATMLGNGGELLDYLEVVGHGKPLTRPPIPFVAIPTTAGTGTEVTRNAVIAVPEHQRKVSLRSAQMLARLAIIDPNLLVSLPSSVIAFSGLDAFTQLIEPLVSVRANPLTDSFCREGIARSVRSLKPAFDGERSLPVLEDLALASLLGGLALANAGLGVVHGLAAVIGGRFEAPHGAICAALLPWATQVNLQALTKRAPTSFSLTRYREIAVLATGLPHAAPQDGVAWIKNQCQALCIPGLSHWGLTANDVADIVAKSQSSSSLRSNPITLHPEELSSIMLQAL